MISKFGVENKNVIEALLERLTMIDSPNFTYRNIKYFGFVVLEMLTITTGYTHVIKLE